MTNLITKSNLTRSFIGKSLLILFVFICSGYANAQVRISQLSENLFEKSNILVVSDADGKENLGIISYEYVVTADAAERLFVLYPLKSDGSVDLYEGYNCGNNQKITFEKTKGRATRTNLPGTFKGEIFIASDGTVTYSEITGATTATFKPYMLVDKRDENAHKSYAIVKIGKQIWMRENLGAKTFANGQSIATGLDKKNWESTKLPAYTVYDNDEATNLPIMGGLYNWYAVASNDSLAPSGWAIPKIDDMNILVEYISPSTFQSAPNEDFSFSFFAGELLKSTDGWTTPPNPGGGSLKPGNNLAMLNCQPFGSTSTSKYFNGYSAKGLQAYFWTADLFEDNDKKATFIRFFWDSQTINYNYEDKFMGYSVRCLSKTPIKIDKNNTSSIENTNNDEQIKILAVQAGSIVIGIPQSLIGQTMTVFTMYGIEVMKQTVNTNAVTLDTSTLSKGIYVIYIGGKALKIMV